MRSHGTDMLIRNVVGEEPLYGHVNPECGR